MIKEIDLSNIPKKGSFYNWSQSVGCSCPFIYGKEHGILSIIDYRVMGKNSEVKIKYKDNEGWIQTSALKRCQIGGIIKLFTADFYYNIGDILHCKTDIQIIDREYIKKDNRNRKLYTYKCLSCGQENQTFEAQLKELKGCPYCAGRIVKEGLNDITTTAPWMIGFFSSPQEASKYTKNSMTKIFPYCPVCRRKQTKEKTISELYNLHKSGCTCDTYMSFPEQVMFNLLAQNDIYFIHRATKKELPWANNYEYDFFIPNKNIIIEMHGAQHYEEHGFSSLGGKTLQEEQLNDQNKQLLAEQNGINYFVIDCRKSNLDFILNNIINSNILEFLSIEIKDKNQLYVNSLINIKNKLKKLKIINPNISKQELIKQLDISPKILNYLLDIIKKEEI